MKNYIGHSKGQIVFATQTPAIYEFTAPEGVTTIEVDDTTYAAIAPTVGQLKFRASKSGFVPIPERPSEFHDWDWLKFEWIENAERAATAYIGQRRAAYPSIGDQLDALWKGGNELEKMREKLLAVKAAIPKPEGTTE